MANRLTMAKIKAILTLHQSGWSYRRIGRELGIRHETASKYIQAAGASKPPRRPPGRSPIRRMPNRVRRAIANPSARRFWPCSIWGYRPSGSGRTSVERTKSSRRVTGASAVSCGA